MKSRISIDFLEKENGLEPCIRIEYNESQDPKDKLVGSLIKGDRNYLEIHKGYKFDDTANIYTLVRETNWTKMRLRVEEIYHSYIENSKFDLDELKMGFSGEYFYFEYGIDEQVFDSDLLFTKDLINFNILQLAEVIIKAIDEELKDVKLSIKKEKAISGIDSKLNCKPIQSEY